MLMSLLGKKQNTAQDNPQRIYEMTTDQLKGIIGFFEEQLRDARIKNPTKVHNPILGYCSQGIIDMAVEWRAISSRKDERGIEIWAVVLPPFREWSEKMSALRELESRRKYAQEQEAKQIDLIAEQEEKVEEIKPEDIPF